MKKEMNKKTIALVATVVLVFGALTGCGSKNVNIASASDSTKGNQAKTITIADQANYYTAKVALKKGFLAEEFGDEYNFDVQIFANGPAINEAMTAGRIEIAEYGDTPAIQAFANDIDVKIISTLWESDNAYALIAGAETGIESTGDLKGKRIGYQAGTTLHQFALKILEKEGLTPSDVTLVNISSTEGIAALSKGEIDTVFTAPPFENAIEQTGGKLITTNKEYYVQPVFILANGTFAKENPEFVSRLLKVFDETNKWIVENVDEATKIVSDFNGADEATVRGYYDNRDWVIGWHNDLTENLSDSIQFSYDNGNITSLFDANDLVDTSYLESAGLYKKE